MNFLMLMYFFTVQRVIEIVSTIIERVQSCRSLMNHGFRKSSNYMSCRIFPRLSIYLLTMVCYLLSLRDCNTFNNMCLESYDSSGTET